MEFHKKREDKAKVRFQMWLALAKRTLTRRGSRINTDRFPKRASKVQASGGGGGGARRRLPPPPPPPPPTRRMLPIRNFSISTPYANYFFRGTSPLYCMTISVLLFVTRGGRESLQLILLVIDTSSYYLHYMIHDLART